VAVEIALLTAMRQGEQLSLRREHVNFEARTIELLETKNGETRYVHMSQQCAELFREQFASHDSDWVFPRRRQKSDGPLNASTLRDSYYRALKRAGLRGLNWHSLRHTAATRLLRAGVNVRTVQHILGHRSIEMTMRYVKVVEVDVTDAMEALAAWPAKNAP
jgi:integrase